MSQEVELEVIDGILGLGTEVAQKDVLVVVGPDKAVPGHLVESVPCDHPPDGSCCSVVGTNLADVGAEVGYGSSIDNNSNKVLHV